MKVALIHPLKHHAYHSLKGIKDSCNEVTGYFGYYNEEKIFDRLLLESKYGSKIIGYKNEEIDSLVYTNIVNKLNFMLYKYNSERFEKNYINYFEKTVINKLDEYDAIHVLQDYCNDVIRYAFKNGKKIIYEQIQPFDILQRNILEEEIEKYNYNKEYLDIRFPKSKIDKQLENIQFADCIITASDISYNSITPYVTDKTYIYKFPYGARVGNITKDELIKNVENKIERKILKVLCIGTINLLKGVQYVIDAAKELENEKIEFTFIGKPLLEEDKKLIKKIQKLKNCIYIGSVPNSEIHKFYLENDIFIFQGLCEGFGMVTLEAMSYGLPCIVSEGGKGVITDNEDGFVVSNMNVEQIVEKIILFYNDREKILKMAKKALEKVEYYSWNKFSQNISKVYTDLEEI